MDRSEKEKELIRSIKFLLFSISAGLIQMSSFALFKELLHWPNWLSYLLALVLSVLWNFTLNRKFTFKSANNWNGYLVTAINMVLNFVTEFLYQRFFVFRDSIDTNDLAKKERGEE